MRHHDDRGFGDGRIDEHERRRRAKDIQRVRDTLLALAHRRIR